jgi:hypothetical protein
MHERAPGRIVCWLHISNYTMAQQREAMNAGRVKMGVNKP